MPKPSELTVGLKRASASSIRKAQAYEAPLLTQLACESKAHWGYSADFLQQCADELKVSAQKMAQDHFTYRVCVCDADILGFYAIERLTVQVAELEALFVTPSEIGQGIGQKLFEHAIEQSKNLGCSSLTIQSDPHAEQFYLAMGASLVGKLESKSVTGRYLTVLSHNLEIT